MVAPTHHIASHAQVRRISGQRISLIPFSPSNISAYLRHTPVNISVQSVAKKDVRGKGSIFPLCRSGKHVFHRLTFLFEPGMELKQEKSFPIDRRIRIKTAMRWVTTGVNNR